MKKNLIRTCIISSLLLSLSIPAFASIGDAGWYSTSLTLPRSGAMTTTQRAATNKNQETQVENNAYDVLGRIVNSGGTSLSSYKTHEAKQDQAYTHNTGTTKGDKISAQFKTSAVNYFTTTATIGWRP